MEKTPVTHFSETSRLLRATYPQASTSTAPHHVVEHSVHECTIDVEIQSPKKSSPHLKPSSPRTPNEDGTKADVSIGPFRLNCLITNHILEIDRIELANACSMIIPAFLSFVLLYLNPESVDRFAVALAWAPAIHFPFAFSYHFYMGLPNPQEYWAFLYFRLDATFIHITSSLYAYGISRNLVYALVTLPLNMGPVILLWLSNKRIPNVKGILISVILYVTPMLWHHGFYAFVLTSVAFSVTLFVWQKKTFGRYYHCIMHVMLGLPQCAMVLYALSMLPKAF